MAKWLLLFFFGAVAVAPQQVPAPPNHQPPITADVCRRLRLEKIGCCNGMLYNDADHNTFCFQGVIYDGATRRPANISQLGQMANATEVLEKALSSNILLLRSVNSNRGKSTKSLTDLVSNLMNQPQTAGILQEVISNHMSSLPSMPDKSKLQNATNLQNLGAIGEALISTLGLSRNNNSDANRNQQSPLPQFFGGSSRRPSFDSDPNAGLQLNPIVQPRMTTTMTTTTIRTTVLPIEYYRIEEPTFIDPATGTEFVMGRELGSSSPLRFQREVPSYQSNQPNYANQGGYQYVPVTMNGPNGQYVVYEPVPVGPSGGGSSSVPRPVQPTNNQGFFNRPSPAPVPAPFFFPTPLPMYHDHTLPHQVGTMLEPERGGGDGTSASLKLRVQLPNQQQQQQQMEPLSQTMLQAPEQGVYLQSAPQLLQYVPAQPVLQQVQLPPQQYVPIYRQQQQQQQQQQQATFGNNRPNNERNALSALLRKFVDNGDNGNNRLQITSLYGPENFRQLKKLRQRPHFGITFFG